jgi:hypothetical protein
MLVSQIGHNHELFPHILVTKGPYSYDVVPHISFCDTPIDPNRLKWLDFLFLEDS